MWLIESNSFLFNLFLCLLMAQVTSLHSHGNETHIFWILMQKQASVYVACMLTGVHMWKNGILTSLQPLVFTLLFSIRHKRSRKRIKNTDREVFFLSSQSLKKGNVSSNSSWIQTPEEKLFFKTNSEVYAWSKIFRVNQISKLPSSVSTERLLLLATYLNFNKGSALRVRLLAGWKIFQQIERVFFHVGGVNNNKNPSVCFMQI